MQGLHFMSLKSPDLTWDVWICVRFENKSLILWIQQMPQTQMPPRNLGHRRTPPFETLPRVPIARAASGRVSDCRSWMGLLQWGWALCHYGMSWFMLWWYPWCFLVKGALMSLGTLYVLMFASCQGSLRSTIVCCMAGNACFDSWRSGPDPKLWMAISKFRLRDVDSRWSQRTFWTAAFGNVWYWQWLVVTRLSRVQVPSWWPHTY